MSYPNGQSQFGSTFQPPAPRPLGQPAPQQSGEPSGVNMFTPGGTAPPVASVNAPPMSNSAPPSAGEANVEQFRRNQNVRRVTPVAASIPSVASRPPQQPVAQSSTLGSRLASQIHSDSGAAPTPTTATTTTTRTAPAPTASPGSTSTRIDPTRVPCPVDRWNAQQRTTFATSSRALAPPAADSSYLVIDDGNAGPRFVRSTIYCVPHTQDLFKKSKLPFALRLTPMAEPGPGEVEVPSVDVSTHDSPVRCSRCRAYLGCAIMWQAGGRSFRCPICHHVDAVPEWYFAPLLPNGRRSDADQHPELYQVRGAASFFLFFFPHHFLF